MLVCIYVSEILFLAFLYEICIKNKVIWRYQRLSPVGIIFSKTIRMIVW